VRRTALPIPPLTKTAAGSAGKSSLLQKTPILVQTTTSSERLCAAKRQRGLVSTDSVPIMEDIGRSAIFCSVEG